MSNTGNINYSLDKNDFYKILVGCISYYIPYYFILVIISLVYIYTIRYQQYIFPERGIKYERDEDIIHYFQSITFNSPFNILNLCESDKGNNKFVGLSNKSYIFIIVSYIITLYLILEGLLRNFLYSIYANIIQVNSNNNPYKNVNCISKIKENAPKLNIEDSVGEIVSRVPQSIDEFAQAVGEISQVATPEKETGRANRIR